jgi:hypothetical protein
VRRAATLLRLAGGDARIRTDAAGTLLRAPLAIVPSRGTERLDDPYRVDALVGLISRFADSTRHPSSVSDLCARV